MYVQSGVENSISDDDIRVRRTKSRGPSDFCRICACFLLFAWGILARCLRYLQRIYSKGVRWYSSTTMSVTQLFIRESSLHNMFWNLHPKSLLSSSENKPVFRFSYQQKQVFFLTKQLEEILSTSISYACSFMVLLRDKAMTTTMFTPFASFLLLRRVDRYIRLLSKPVGKIATTSFNQRK